MQPVATLLAASFRDIEIACVSDILATIKATGYDYMLVVEPDAVGRPFLRGLFSTAQVARQLGEPASSLIDEPVDLGQFTAEVLDQVSEERAPAVTASSVPGATSTHGKRDSPSDLIQALEHAAAGDWDSAHTKVQESGGRHARLIHGYLHRIEGDLAHARSWYEQGGESMPGNSLSDEWDRLMGMVKSTQ